MRFLTLFKLRVRMDFDQLLSVGVTFLAIALAIGYQVLRHKVGSSDSEPPTRP
jgi:hypothetical protein